MPPNSIPIRHRIRGGVSVIEGSDSSDDEPEIEVSGILNTDTGKYTQNCFQFSASLESIPDLPHPSTLSPDLFPLAKSFLLNEPVDDPPHCPQASSQSSETIGDLHGDKQDPSASPAHPADGVPQGNQNSTRPNESSERAYQGASAKMKKFIDNIQPLQDAIFFGETHPQLGKPCACGSETDVKYRCNSCSQSPLHCKNCILNRHHNLIFHRISVWESGFFNPVSLKDLGLGVYLGHCGARCPNLSSTSTPRPLVLVDTNGFHHASVYFCHCDDAPEEFIQLMRAQLFPATVTQPGTAFSFDLLNNFHNHTLTSKKSPYDYHEALTRLTDAAFSKDVPNRYPELCRVSRVWRYLALLRCSGQSHEINDFLKHRRIRSVVIRCPACPEVGFNIDEAEIELVAEDEKHKYTLFISADGNFRLQRKAKNGDPDDVSLTEGQGYFADMKAFESSTNDDDAAVCAHLRAVRLQNIVKFRNAVISGVVSIQCARHGFHLPQGMADLTKGESYSRTDYALKSSLEDQSGQRWLMMSYNIWCSYSVRLKQRFAELYPESAEIIERMRGAVPKMHFKNHIVACQQLWAFNYLQHSGETCGELIETSWAELNQASGSTKEMNEGNRHDTLADFAHFRNWMKKQTIAESIAESYAATLANLAERSEAFAKFSERFDDTLIKTWKARPSQTQASAYQKLVDEENVKLLSRSGDMGDSSLVNTGLDLDEERLRLVEASYSDTYSTRTLASERKAYRSQAVEWLRRYTLTYPQIHSHTETVDEDSPETTILPLPSTMNQPTRAALGLVDLAEVELSLRKGQAHDALADLRIAIKRYNFNLKWKKDHVFGQGPNTKAQRVLDELVDERTAAVKRYQRIQGHMLVLGLDPNDPTLRPIVADEDDPRKTKNMSLPSKLGDTKKTDPWFWNTDNPSGLSKKEEAEWSIEMDRVKRFRDRAARDRAQEEKEILEEEMKRVVRSFKNYATIWTSLASEERPNIVGVPGKASYALRQAAMYTRFAEDAEKRFENARNPPAATTTKKGKERPKPRQ